MHRYYIVSNLKAFKEQLLSKARLEVHALEFHVTINQDCIATGAQPGFCNGGEGAFLEV